jgi:hypothetical protein
VTHGRHLRALGATVVERYDDITTMRDHEGNELCFEPGPGDPHEASGRRDPVDFSVDEVDDISVEAGNGLDHGPCVNGNP